MNPALSRPDGIPLFWDGKGAAKQWVFQEKRELFLRGVP
jgi:hypothetical protein